MEEHFSRFLVQATFQEDFRAAVDREARADLVEKRKQTEAELEALCLGGVGGSVVGLMLVLHC